MWVTLVYEFLYLCFFFTVFLFPDMLLLLVAGILLYRANNKFRSTFTEATTSFSTKYFTKSNLPRCNKNDNTLTISKKNLRPVLAFLWLLACRCWPRIPQCEEEWQTVAVRYLSYLQLQRQGACGGVYGVATSLRY